MVGNAKSQLNYGRTYIPVGNHLRTKSDVVERLYQNFKTQITLLAILDLEEKLQDMCLKASCKGTHESAELLFRDFTFQDQMRDIIEEVMTLKDMRKWLDKQISQLVPHSIAKVLKNITGNEADALISNEFKLVFGKSMTPTLRLLKKTPGIVGVWMYCIRHEEANESKEEGSYTTRQIIEHEGQIVKIVSRALDINPGTLAWKSLAQMKSEDAYARLQRLSRSTQKMDKELLAFGAALKIEAMSGLDLKVTVIKRVETVLMSMICDEFIEADWTTIQQLLLEFVRQSELSTEQRGYSLSELRRNLTYVMDWVNVIFIHTPKEQCVLRPRRWKGFVKSAKRWHDDFNARMLELTRRTKIDEATQKRWKSLVEEYDYSDALRVIPMVNETDLAVESTLGRNCVGRGYYAEVCVRERTRIFSVRKFQRSTEAGQKVSHFATVQIGLNSDESRWLVVQVKGTGNAQPTDLMNEVAQDIATRYSAEWQIQDRYLTDAPA